MTLFVVARSARAEELCPLGSGSPAALKADASQKAGEEELAAASATSEDDPARSGELAKAEQHFRDALGATTCLFPLNAVRLGQTLELQGRPLAAAEAYERVTALRSKAQKYRLYSEALALATQGSAAARKKVAAFDVVVLAQNCGEPVALINGEPAPVGLHEREPGILTLEVSAQGCVAQSIKYVLHKGARRRVQFVLIPPILQQPRPPPPKCVGVFCPRWLWYTIGGAAVLAAGGSYIGYRASSHDSEPSIPSGTLGRAQMP